MTFEEQIRVIELKELSIDDARQVYTKLFCISFENKDGDLRHDRDMEMATLKTEISSGNGWSTNALHSRAA